ncbi:hypothetical protein FS837_005133, partial [Tulasnella sp. UAMH 9824]
MNANQALNSWGWILDLHKSRDAFVSRIWQKRRQQANMAKGIVPPPAIAPAGALQVHVPPAALLAVVQQPPPGIPPNNAAPPTSIELEDVTGRHNNNPRQ